MENFNEKEVRECYHFLNHLNETEIRIIDPQKKKSPQSIFISSEDEFVKVCKEQNGKFLIYAGINEREPNGTSKKDVISVKTIVIDIDAIKEKGFEKEPATDIELQKAELICDSILMAIEKSGQPLPVKVHSGNGFQLWFSIPEITINNYNRQDIEDKIQLFQDRIIDRFDENNAIDKIGDLPRIIKVWGTYNIKSITGKETEDRKFRVAKVIGEPSRIDNPELKERILNLEPKKFEYVEINDIEDIDLTKLPPCISHLLKFYENKDGKYWYRIIQFLGSFFMSIGLNQDKTKSIILDWNKKQPYHEDGEEQEIIETIGRVYRNKIFVANCKKIKTQTGGFPYFGLAELKICKKDSKCNRCINPVIRYKRDLDSENKLQVAGNAITNKFILADDFFEIQPFFYDRNKIWWIWDFKGFRWEQVDEVDILNAISKNHGANTINSKERGEILESLKQKGRKCIPEKVKKTWVQFKDIIVDVETGESSNASANYFVTNPIQFEIGEDDKTPIMDKIFKQWVGEDYVQTLYEIIAYCTLPDYPIHRLFCLIGDGSNGKSCFLKLISKFVGFSNITSTELDDLINSRFERAKLYKKLICLMGETNFSTIKKTSLIKRLTGQDTISFEFKNKTPFDDFNYAKIIIATNGLPYSEDKTDGFYRRWFIVNFPNKFTESKDILKDIPEEEYNALAKKSVTILKELISNRSFTNEGTVEVRKEKYEELSNPVDKFIEVECIKSNDLEIPFYKFYDELLLFISSRNYRTISKPEVSRILQREGFEIKTSARTKSDGKQTTWKVICGLNLKYEDMFPRYEIIKDVSDIAADSLEDKQLGDILVWNKEEKQLFEILEKDGFIKLIGGEKQ